MSDSFKKLRRRQLAQTLERLDPFRAVERPPKGWLKAIREELGMTMQQAADRLGVTKSMISKYEKAEVEGTITLATLRRAAGALSSELVYAAVSKEPIEEILGRRAHAVARRRIDAVHRSMVLEDQAISREERQRQIADLAEDLLEKRPRTLWDEV